MGGQRGRLLLRVLVLLRVVLVVRVVVLLRWRRLRVQLTLMGASGPA
ncbi:hypothetical protein OOK31_19485 [Streptomyces sp. NBC_00249]|nr:hypothetical protein [Streptomyces sp. NBC_00249]MCX5196051.1 hypothetical protein [Streptomyces sp. NBC_00249]